MSHGTRSLLKQLSRRPVSYFPVFADVAGSVNAGIMLSQAMYWSERTDDPDGWFYKTQDEWHEETRLTRSEQEGARKKLRSVSHNGSPLWEEDRRGQPAKLYFRLDEEVLAFLIAEIPHTGMRKSCKLDSAKPAIFNNTEITTETTSDIFSPDSDEPTNVAPSKSESPSIRVIDNPNPGVVVAEVDGETVVGVDPALTPEKPKRKSNLSPEEEAIFEVYCQENNVEKAANFGRLRKETKAIISEAGSNADEIRDCMRWMRRDHFWQGKVIQIISVHNKLDEFRATARSAETNVSPLTAEDTEWAKNHQFVPAFGHGWVERELERRKREQQEMDGLL